MTAPASPSIALSAARQAQKRFRRHYARCHVPYCRTCRILELTVSAAYARSDAAAERMRALDAAREARS